MSSLNEPIILWPPTTAEAVWKDCKEFVEEQGGLLDGDGNVNLMAASGADPGVTSCPGCYAMHWNYGLIHQCPTCLMIYPTDWWPMYSYGVQAARRIGILQADGSDAQLRRNQHPYWKYGFDHPVEAAYEERRRIDWRAVIGDCYIYGGQFGRHVEDYRALVEGAHAQGNQSADKKDAQTDTN